MRILEKLKPLGLLILRLALGVIFLFSGYQKLVVSTAATLQDFHRMGLPPYLGYIAGVLELFGAILLIVGLLTRLAALLLAIDVALVLIKLRIPDSGIYHLANYQFLLVLFAATFALATVGAGLFSLDAATFEAAGKQRSKGKVKT